MDKIIDTLHIEISVDIFVSDRHRSTPEQRELVGYLLKLVVMVLTYHKTQTPSKSGTGRSPFVRWLIA